MSGNNKKLIAFNYFGGKFTWLEHLYTYFPNDFVHLVDLFAGSFAVSLNYKGKVVKTANEINGEITNFFEILRDHEAELIRLLNFTPCSNLEYNNCWNPSENKIERARRFYVRVRQSFFGLGAQKQNKGWHMAKEKSNINGGETVRKWNNALLKLEDVAVVIRNNFQITNFNYLKCIEKLDFPKSFFYCDPPYPRQTRASYNDYMFEFTTDDHIQLSERLHQIAGYAMISSYESKLYDDLYKDWVKIKFPVKKNNIRSSEVQEIIYINYNPPEPIKSKTEQLKLKI